MDTRKLEINGLRVESFSAGGAADAAGIVAAQASGHPDCTSVYLCTLQTCGLPACPA
jgi:hypothetical protein